MEQVTEVKNPMRRYNQEEKQMSTIKLSRDDASTLLFHKLIELLTVEEITEIRADTVSYNTAISYIVVEGFMGAHEAVTFLLMKYTKRLLS